ncbi:MAG: hypothetical protein L0241_27450, partial [Planctomycetia bacterium]|nr:hypothetical protein [Planctomycetia bacterium]
AGNLLVWDNPGTKPAKIDPFPAGAFNSTLAVRIDNTKAVTEVITGGVQLEKRIGALTFRTPAGKEKLVKTFPAPAPGEVIYPVALAAVNVKDIGEVTAFVGREKAPPGAGNWQHKLHFLSPRGAVEPVPLPGMRESTSPVLTASADGQFIAVGGFTDNRVEVYNTADLAANRGKPQLLAGNTSGFQKVAFLTGGKVWLGGSTDTIAKGGVMLDPAMNARTATPNDGKGTPDAPPKTPEPKLFDPDPIKKLPGRVTYTLDGKEHTISLGEGERPTSAALLPAKPAWNPKGEPVIVIASLHVASQTVYVTLFDARTDQPFLELGGPTLPVRSLAFSGTRPLLAAAGDDTTVAVWSLRNATKQPAIIGLLVTERDGSVVVASVQPDTPVAKLLTAGEVIEAVGGEKGDLKPVKTPLEFIRVVRSLKEKDNARIK